MTFGHRIYIHLAFIRKLIENPKLLQVINQFILVKTEVTVVALVTGERIKQIIVAVEGLHQLNLDGEYKWNDKVIWLLFKSTSIYMCIKEEQ